MSLQVGSEIRRQMDIIRKDGRGAAEIVAGPEMRPAVVCDTAFIPFSASGGVYGLIFNVMIREDCAVRGLRVLPLDWGGYGQGMTRPGGVA